MLSFDFLEKGQRIASPHHILCMNFQKKKNNSHVIFYYLTGFHCLVAFTL